MPTPSIYLDYASTTPLDPRVLEAMMPYFQEVYANAESQHSQGKKALIAIDTARETIAKIINCRTSEIISTGSATEANNLAILGIARKNKDQGRHIISTPIEHPSIKEPLAQLEKEGFEVTYLKVDKYGIIDLIELESSIRPDTTLVSIIHGNNEIGTIQPIKEIGEICEKKGVPLHTDSCQTACTESLDTKDFKASAMTFNGSKIYGPKGVGVLYIAQNLKIEKVLYGGEQENNLRPGTHNTPSIIGMAKALELVQKDKESEKARLTTLRDKLSQGLIDNIPSCRLNGHPTKRLANNVSISIDKIDIPHLILILDEYGIYASAGSACSAGSAHPSHVLQAIHSTEKNPLTTSLRLTLGHQTTDEDIDYVIATIPPIIAKING